MTSWTITALESTTPLCEGASSNPRRAWQNAIDAALVQLTAGRLEGCAIVLDGGIPALLMPGRTVDGQLDLPSVRAAAERMAIAVLGGVG